jgi:hypothetical protein
MNHIAVQAGEVCRPPHQSSHQALVPAARSSRSKQGTRHEYVAHIAAAVRVGQGSRTVVCSHLEQERVQQGHQMSGARCHIQGGSVAISRKRAGSEPVPALTLHQDSKGSSSRSHLLSPKKIPSKTSHRLRRQQHMQVWR